MGNVTVLWSLGAAVAIVLAILCGLMWLMERRDIASLMLCILGVATAAAAYAELGVLLSTTPAEFGAWVRWYHLPIFLGVIAQVLFVRTYLEAGTAWLMWATISARSFVVVVNFMVTPNYNFASIESLSSMSLLGDRVSTIGSAVRRPDLQWVAVASLVFLAVYVIDAVARSWRKRDADSRRRALAVGVAVVPPMLCTIVYGQLLLFGLFHGPISNLPWFLGTLSMMAYVSGRDFVLSRRARLEVAELRSQLAQIERVNLLGQLASALAHELSQPLTSISMNVAAARKLRKQIEPDVEELASILDDIRTDNQRAVKIIDGMRQLFKQRAVDLKPIKIEDVVRNALSLVRSEADSKHVVVNSVIQPGLPPVFGDSVHLSQVLLNLLLNGIQAVQSGSIDTRLVVVEVHADERAGEVEICVKDSGPGIPGTIADRIFEPLFTTKTEGMGMGLALSHAIIEAHGGRLWADTVSEPPGAVFRFSLRRA